MKNEDKIKELEERVSKLEKIEHNRRIKNIIILCFYVIILITIIVTCIYFFNKLKPYKEKLDNLQNLGENLKRDSVVDGYDDYGNFGFEDFFNNFFNY